MSERSYHGATTRSRGRKDEEHEKIRNSWSQRKEVKRKSDIDVRCILSSVGCTAPNHMTARSEFEVHRQIYTE